MSRKSMITVAKEFHSDKIARLLHPAGDVKIIRATSKDLMKLNYTTLVELSPRVKK